MRLTTLPGTSLRPSILGLGTGSFGSGISTDDSFRMMDEFAAAGGNLLDSAHIYAAWLPNGVGASERTVGEWVRKSGLRDKIIVATKGGHYDLATPDVTRIVPECIDWDIAESLERLQLDTIDLYYLHRDNLALPVAELLDVLQPHLRAGRIKAIGASNWSPERLQLAHDESTKRGWTGFCCCSNSWSLAEANAAVQGQFGMYYVGADALRWHRATGFPLVAYTSQAQGFFAQSWTWPDLPDPTKKQQALQKNYWSEKNVARWQRVQTLAAKLGVSANTLALAYVTSQSFPTAALIGPTRIEQLRESLAAAYLQLSPEQIAYLEDGVQT